MLDNMVQNSSTASIQGKKKYFWTKRLIKQLVFYWPCLISKSCNGFLSHSIGTVRRYGDQKRQRAQLLDDGFFSSLTFPYCFSLSLISISPCFPWSPYFTLKLLPNTGAVPSFALANSLAMLTAWLRIHIEDPAMYLTHLPNSTEIGSKDSQSN